MNQPPTACVRCQQAECICKPDDSPVAIRAPKTSQHDKLLTTSRWRKLSQAIRSYNPQCQHVVNGKRCEHAGEEVHHLSTDLTLFFNPANLVALCKECHFKFQGEPAGTEREYAPTRWILGAALEHPRPVRLGLQPGEVRITGDGIAVIGR